LTANRRGTAAVVLLALFPIASAAQSTPPARVAGNIARGSAPLGEELFTGTIHLRNQGPACISCHRIAGLPFPNGGTLGPDLTGAYKKLGPQGTQSAMQTLYFKVMTPIYGAHPLFPDEQADLMAYLEQAESRPQSQWNTQIVLLAAVVLGAAFVAITGFMWRDRVRSVRRAMVERAAGQGAPL
jgi:mono/diheme cytochrome c family protein